MSHGMWILRNRLELAGLDCWSFHKSAEVDLQALERSNRGIFGGSLLEEFVKNEGNNR
jgi:hypothetical protein